MPFSLRRTMTTSTRSSVDPDLRTDGAPAKFHGRSELRSNGHINARSRKTACSEIAGKACRTACAWKPCFVLTAGRSFQTITDVGVVIGILPGPSLQRDKTGRFEGERQVNPENRDSPSNHC